MPTRPAARRWHTDARVSASSLPEDVSVQPAPYRKAEYSYAFQKRPSLIKSFKNKGGKTFDAHVTFDKDFRTVYEFPPRTDKAKGKGGRR